MTKGVLEEKFVSEFFCLYFIGNLHAVTEHGEVVVKGVFAVNLLPDGLTGCIVISQSSYAFGPDKQLHEGSGFPSQFAIAALSGSTQTTVKNTKENGLSKM